MKRFLPILVAACGAPPPGTAQQSDIAAALGPQSFTHGTVRGRPLSFLFHASANDMIAADVWPTGKSPLHPTLLLLDPQGNVIARGAPRGLDARHIAVDNGRLLKTGNYLLLVGGDGGQFTLRLWMESSHLPRQEAAQIDMTTRPSAAMLAAMDTAARWTDADVDALIDGIRKQPDLRVALSDVHLLLWLLQGKPQLPRARAAAAALVGSPRHFRSLDRELQAFALWWLGNLDGLLFDSADAPGPPSIDESIARFLAAWPGARESGRRVQARRLNGALYGWQADWSAVQTDLDGREVWIDFASEWFDARGDWLGEVSAGASEPDDD